MLHPESLKVRWLPILLVVGSLLGRSEATINVTGDWYFQWESGPVLLHLIQNGTALNASGPWPINNGTIDSTTGAFTLNLGGIIQGGSCGVSFQASLAPDRTFTGTAYVAGPPPGCQSIGCFCSGSFPRPLYGSVSPCGNGGIDPGEECDDGNLAPGDCCSRACRAEPAGAACADEGNRCTDDTCDGGGACIHPPNSAPCDTVCAPGGTCTAGTCVSSAPAPSGTPCESDGNECTREACDGASTCASLGAIECDTCRTCLRGQGCIPFVRSSCADPGRRTRIDLRNGAIDAGDALAWTWSDASAGEGAESFGDPTASTDYELCAFAAPDAGTDPLLALSVPAGGTCGGDACWRATPQGFRYHHAAPGVTSVVLRATTRVGTALSVRGRGAALGMPTNLDLGSLLVQLTARDRTTGDDLVCWQARYAAPGHHTARHYVAER
jgi:cysteine-rich repeat protein